MKKILFEFYVEDDFDFDCCSNCPFHYNVWEPEMDTRCSLANFGIDCPADSKKYYVQPVNN